MVFATAGLTEDQSTANRYPAAAIRVTERDLTTNVIFSSGTKISDSARVTERYCPAVANTFSLYALVLNHSS